MNQYGCWEHATVPLNYSDQKRSDEQITRIKSGITIILDCYSLDLQLWTRIRELKIEDFNSFFWPYRYRVTTKSMGAFWTMEQRVEEISQISYLVLEYERTCSTMVVSKPSHLLIRTERKVQTNGPATRPYNAKAKNHFKANKHFIDDGISMWVIIEKSKFLVQRGSPDTSGPNTKISL